MSATFDPRQQLACLIAYAAANPSPRPRPLTDAELAREDWLEGRAQARADDSWVSDRDADRAADLYYGGAS